MTSAVYLMQTVLGVLLIGALNEARDERVTAFWMMLATFAIWAVQLGVAQRHVPEGAEFPGVSSRVPGFSGRRRTG